MEKPTLTEEEMTARLKAIGQQMKSLRKAKGFSNYEQFAYLNNIGRSQYGKYEKGADMRLSTFLRVLHALDVSPVDFFNGEEVGLTDENRA